MTLTNPAGTGQADQDAELVLLPELHREDTDEGWGERESPDDLARLRAERPPHHDR